VKFVAFLASEMYNRLCSKSVSLGLTIWVVLVEKVVKILNDNVKIIENFLSKIKN